MLAWRQRQRTRINLMSKPDERIRNDTQHSRGRAAMRDGQAGGEPMKAVAEVGGVTNAQVSPPAFRCLRPR